MRCAPMRKVSVCLAFECDVEDLGGDEIRPGIVGQQLCRLIQAPGQFGNPDWIATPRAVGLISACDVPVKSDASSEATK